MPSDAPRLSPSRTWMLLGASFLTFSIGAGFMHSYTVFLVAFVEAFAWSRAEVSIAYAVSQLVSGVTSPFIGMLVDRLGPRRLVMLGGVVLTAGLLASSQATELWHMVVLYGVVMTLGANCFGLVVFVPLLSRYLYATAAWRWPWCSRPTGSPAPSRPRWRR